MFRSQHRSTKGRIRKREKILMDHLKEITNNLNQLEEEFGQEEREWNNK